MPTMKQVQQIIQQGDYTFSIDLKDDCLPFAIGKHISGKFCHLHWLQSLGFSLHLLNPYLSFASARVFMLLYFWMISWSWLMQSRLPGVYKPFSPLCWLIFQVWTPSHSFCFLLRTVLGYSQHFFIFTIWKTY